MYRQIKSIYKGTLGEIRFSRVGLIEWQFGTTRSLSLKYVVNGKENYIVGGRHFELTNNEILFFSQGQSYTAFTESSKDNDGFCIDLDDSFMEEARKDMFGEKLLFDLNQDFKAIKVWQPNPHFHIEMKKVFVGIEANDKLCMEESLSELMGLYLELEKEFSDKLRSVPTLKDSVKKEVFHKLLMAQSYLHDSMSQTPSLEDIALASGLSKFYLQRLFSKVFGQSPSQYLEKLKMEAAFSRIQTKAESISQICYSLGFSDLAYFSRRFKRYFGCSPKHMQKAL